MVKRTGIRRGSKKRNFTKSDKRQEIADGHDCHGTEWTWYIENKKIPYPVLHAIMDSLNISKKNNSLPSHIWREVYSLNEYFIKFIRTKH